ncbi:MAG TPA: carboxypeptidase-like regulatory domain-containing protein, partial [Candidatus Limnocylindrales bacterium]
AARLRPMNATSVPRHRFAPAGLLVFVVLAFAACASSAASPGSSLVGSGGSPAASSTPSSPANPSTAPVASAEAAFDAVRARSPWFDGVKPKDPNLIGQASWWQATPSTDGAWAVTVDVGWGDCPAGCINHHVWQWQVAKDGSVTLASETGSAIPEDQRAALAAAAMSSGIGGMVTAGPTCPVERPGDSACAERAVKGAVLDVQDGSGAQVATFTTDASGLFRIDLPPGAYTLAAQPVTGIMRAASPQPVAVAEGKLTIVSLSYDTGIR